MTITHELTEEQYPELHDQLRTRRPLLSALDDSATLLNDRHSYWMTAYRLANAHLDRAQQGASRWRQPEDPQECLRYASPAGPPKTGNFSPDTAIASIHRPTPPTEPPPAANPSCRCAPRPTLSPPGGTGGRFSTAASARCPFPDRGRG